MSVVKLTRCENPFEILPRATLQDSRLSLDALGALVRLASLPGDWEWQTWHLEKEVLRIGRDHRRRIFNELEQTGYLTRSKKKDERGRWQHEYNLQLDSTEAASTSDGLSVAGESTAGQGVDIQKTYSQKTDLHKTQQQPSAKAEGEPAAQVGGGSDLIFDKAIEFELREKLTAILVGVESVLAQQVIDVLAAQRSTTKHPLRLVKFLAGNLDSFDPAPGFKIANARKNEKAVRDSNQLASQAAKDPEAAKSGQSIIEKCRRKRQNGK